MEEAEQASNALIDRSRVLISRPGVDGGVVGLVVDQQERAADQFIRASVVVVQPVVEVFEDLLVLLDDQQDRLVKGVKTTPVLE